MATKVIDAQLLQKAFIAGAYNLERNKDYINELNVFPVPDGDTGSNMSLTIMAAAREVSALENPSMDELSKKISSGSAWSKRKFRCYLIPASAWLLQGDQGQEADYSIGTCRWFRTCRRDGI